jgi:hypothetical protein
MPDMILSARTLDHQARPLAFNRLGVDRDNATLGKIGASRILHLLGKDLFSECLAVRVPGKVIWCNYELARDLGFDVPRSNLMTPGLHKQLIDALSFQTLPKKEKAGGRETITIYADKYGGSGVAPALGSARSGFLRYGNLFIKGIGFTPLFKHDDPDDFAHSTGSLALDEGLVEALFGEVNTNLFTLGSTRILAIIDQKKTEVYPNGQRKLCAIIARSGAQLRPGHLLARQVRRPNFRLELFTRLTRETGQLVTRRAPPTNRDVTDVKATMLRIIDDHARVSAEQFRWRVIHGAISPSNMEMSGALLDLATQTTQPRTAPIYVLDFTTSIFGREHTERASELLPVYRALINSIPKEQRSLFNATALDLVEEMERAYRNHLPVTLLGAAGLRPEAAERLQTDWAGIVGRFAEVVMKMAKLKNPGSKQAPRRRPYIDSAAVLDVFRLLQSFPPKYFSRPAADHRAAIRAGLRPLYKGNKYHLAKVRAVTKELIIEFAKCYREIMAACEAIAPEFYGDLACMQGSIKARAAFENRPLSALYSSKLNRDVDRALASYQANGNIEVFRETIDKRVAVSLRNIDALLQQGQTRRLARGGLELQIRAIEGVCYSVRAWDDTTQTRRLRVSIPAKAAGTQYILGSANQPRLTREQLRALRYRYSIDGRAHFGDVAVRLSRDERDKSVISCEIDCRPLTVGELAGSFYIDAAGNRTARKTILKTAGYVCAVPDRMELRRLRELWQAQTGARKIRGGNVRDQDRNKEKTPETRSAPTKYQWIS